MPEQTQPDISLPSTHAMEQTPPLPAETSGIAIVGPESARLTESLVLHGAFRVGEEAAASLSADLHRAVTLAVTSLHENWTIDPFRLAMLFEDDLRPDPGGVGGSFALDLAAYRPVRYPGTYYVTASVGPYTSETLVLEILA